MLWAQTRPFSLISVNESHLNESSFRWLPFYRIDSSFSLSRLLSCPDEIRQAALLFHSQGMYPGARQVFQRLGNLHAIRTKEGHEAWRLTLEELGYPTDHLKAFMWLAVLLRKHGFAEKLHS